MTARTVNDAHTRIDEIEKKIVRIETRIDEKFIGIDGRLKHLDITIDNLQSHIDRKFTTLMTTGFLGLIALVGVILGVK